ncbi:hypothetical protein LSH36_48g04025 [Paralvinella palmiformis]|uniref:Serine aminopeptidase S33 domain-containing protein n=1 Tax=Paralvinella palmiformis TaxID=53620 RepID=A0AAD9K6Y7_9ANNE|nr:hypothetical protein LSH36_48g04025 [Paralvinella palmiformis]
MWMYCSICILILGSAIIFLVWYLKFIVAANAGAPKIYYTRSTLTKHILNHGKHMLRPLQVPFWNRNGHTQTILTYLAPRPNCKFSREYILLKDGGAVALDWIVELDGESRDFGNTDPILIVIPELGSDAYTVSPLCRLASKHGCRSVVFNRRGHGHSFLLTAKLQEPGDPSDLRSVVEYVQSQFPRSTLSAVAYGMGTNVLFSYMGEYGSSCRLSSVVCVSPGYEAEYILSRCLSFPYHFAMLYMSKRELAAHAASLSKVVNVAAAMATNSLIDFEELLYCRPAGYASMERYWEHNNPMREVDEVTIPVLCINSLDDPICKKRHIPYSLFTDCPNFMLLTTTTGGHCGFLEGSYLERWADKVAVDYILSVLSFTF